MPPISRRRRGGPTRHHISRRFRLSAASSRTIQFSRNEERKPSHLLRPAAPSGRSLSASLSSGREAHLSDSLLRVNFFLLLRFLFRKLRTGGPVREASRFCGRRLLHPGVSLRQLLFFRSHRPPSLHSMNSPAGDALAAAPLSSAGLVKMLHRAPLRQPFLFDACVFSVAALRRTTSETGST